MDFFALPGVLLSLIIILSVTFNGAVIAAFIRFKSIVKVKDAYLFSLAVSDLLQALIGYPVEVNVMFDGGRQIESHACSIFGFFITFFGLSSINHLVYLAIDRTIVMRFPYHTELWKSAKTSIVSFIVIWGCAFCWAALPLFGWSSYGIEPDGVRCSINWDDKSTSGRAYIYALFTFEFAFPVLALSTSFVVVRKVTREMHQRHIRMTGAVESTTKKHNQMIVSMALAFLIAWTPYALVSIYGVIGGSLISAKVTTFVAIAAKSSTIFNPVIYALTYNDFQRKCKQFFCVTEVGVEPPVSSTHGEQTV